MTTTEISVKMILDRWYASVKNFETLLGSLSDEDLQQEISPGKNRGVYLLGHLVAVHDDMLILLDMGDKMYPELHEPFLKMADKQTDQVPSGAVLREYWTEQTTALNDKIGQLPVEAWFEKHTAVSREDFEREPHRNKLNIIITRTSHLQYHIGQMRLLK